MYIRYKPTDTNKMEPTKTCKNAKMLAENLRYLRLNHREGLPNIIEGRERDENQDFCLLAEELCLHYHEYCFQYFRMIGKNIKELFT